MPYLPGKSNAPAKFATPDYLTLGNFKRGVITLIDKSRLPQDALAEASNLWLVEDGQPSQRPGTNWYGTAPSSSEIEGFDYFDDSGAVHLIVAAGGKIYRSLDDGNTWTQCTGATYTVGNEVNMNQYNAYLYITTGVDTIIRYDGTTTLQTYTALTTPSAPTAATTPSSPGTTYTYYYKISAVSPIGFSAASTYVTVQHGIPRENWDKTTNYITLTLPTYQTTQTRYDIYFSQDNLNYYYLDSVSTPNLSYKDDGTAQVIPSTTAPLTNTTTGPTVSQLTNVGSRMFGVNDPNNPYRIWFTSGTPPYGSFSNGYDGGYLDWQPGGKYRPVRIEDYRDGKGTPMATIWCDSADGQGCIIQMSLETMTIGSISITVPTAYKLPGSRGTPAPKSVVNVLNDYVFYNTQAFYNLGSRPQLLQILSTDEMSANIRPTVRTISHAAEKNIAAQYYLAKIYISVPYNSTVNNATIVYDTERKAWMPNAFTVGFKRFLHYTDTGRGQHLIAVRPGDNRLTEISETIEGDYGQAFNTDLLTGLYPVSKDRFQFQFTEEMEYEFSNPQGTIYLELLGIDRSKGMHTVKTVPLTISTSVTNAGWDTQPWDISVWDNTSIVPSAYSESSVKRYTPAQANLNAVQWHIYTNTLDAKYVLRTLQTWGTPDDGGKPAKWRVRAL